LSRIKWDYLAGGHGAFDGVEKADELLMAKALPARPNRRAVENGEQRGATMAGAIIGHGIGLARHKRQTRLGAIEGHMLLAAIAIGDDRFEANAIISRDKGTDFLRYANGIAYPGRTVNPMNASVH
jgi:hypothetical protein